MADITKPRAPVVTAKMQNRVELTWSGASDNVGIARYEAWDGKTFLKELDRETRVYTTPPLAVGQHKLRIVAYDAAGNHANSAEVEVTILAGGSGAVQSVAATTAVQT